MFYVRGAENCDVCERRRREKLLGGSVVQTLLCHRAPQECHLTCTPIILLIFSGRIHGKHNKFSEKASNCDTKSCYVYETLWHLRFHVVSLVN